MFKYAYHIAIRVLLTAMKFPYRALMLFFNYPVLLEYLRTIMFVQCRTVSLDPHLDDQVNIHPCVHVD